MADRPVYRTMREQIADRIRSDVLSGRIESGTSLREIPLAKQYGVSRAPVRDALLQLTHEGLLEAKPNCGVRVSAPIQEDLQPLIVQLRRKIESFALELAFENFNEEDIVALDETVEGLKKACHEQDMANIVHFDMALHRYIIEAAGSSELVSIWLPIVSRMWLHYSRHRDLMESYREHAEIVKAIREKDRAAAFEALLANIQ